MSLELQSSDQNQTKRDIPSFIEPRPPLILNPFMRPRPQKGTNLMELFDDSESEEADWVQVYLRLKPCIVRNNLYDVKNDRCLITSVDTATAGHGRRTQHCISKMYTFSHIFRAECTQKEIFERVVKDNLKKLPEGHNFTLLTYGASGSGKTYTLMGTVTAPGLVPRSLEYVFRVVDAAQQPIYKPSDGGAEKLGYSEQEYEFQFVKKLRQLSAPARDKYRRMSAQLRNDMNSTWDLSNRTRYYVWVSFIEIYNEAIYDLLTNSDRSKATSKLRIREDTNGNVYVKGATQAFVRSGEEAYDVMVAGKHNLQVAATGVHANSSRSHCIFTITMLTETDSGVRASCVRLCDLAGSERARQTRNTGARMQESRAINSSLHVLERCLHMLRRKQRQGIDSTLVPYRESKLTRLLGAGLSGSRGEGVSMVVTLNPAPDYAQETKHVLQLAAVARDIQVNQTTIAESTLESTVDTTAESSAEVMKLRADNERLHYELAQAESHNRKLIAAMEKKQQEAAKTMFEIVEETKDMTKQYYESKLKSVCSQMEEMQEEYEQRLKILESDESRVSHVGTPSKTTKTVADLLTDIAILEEKLTAEKLARARAEQEVQHLRACIEDRDEKFHDVQRIENEEEILTESESEEEDPANESLEPSFKKEDINRSRLLQRSVIDDTAHNDSKMDSEHENNLDSDNDSDNNGSVVEKSGDTLKDIDDSRNDTNFTNDDNHTNETYHDVFGTSKTNEKNNETLNANQVIDDGNKSAPVKGTYFVKKPNSNVRETYFVRNSLINCKASTSHDDSSIKENDDDSKNITIDSNKSNTTMDIEPQTVKKNHKSTHSKDVSLALFEQLEKEENTRHLEATHASKVSLGQFEQLQKAAKATHASDSSLAQVEESEKTTNTRHLKTNIARNASLAQFEQLEMAENSRKQSIVKDTTELLSNIKTLKQTRNFFNENLDDDPVLLKLNKEKPYFDNKFQESKKILFEDRSPSIVKEDITNYEPSTIKKLLGESFTRSDIISSVHKNVIPKKQASVDIFDSPREGFDSLNIFKPKESTPAKIKYNLGIESACKSTEKRKFFDSMLNENAKTSCSNLHSENIEDIKDILATKTTDDDVFVKPTVITTITKKPNELSKEKLSILETCIEKVDKKIEVTRKSIEQMVLDRTESKTKFVTSIVEKNNEKSILNLNETTDLRKTNENNTIDEFENLIKDITLPRTTEFELLVSQNNTMLNQTNAGEEDSDEKPKYNLRHKGNTSLDKKEPMFKIDNTVEKKDKSMEKQDKTMDRKGKIETEEIVLESRTCESKTKQPKRNLRLRRRKNKENDIINQEEKNKTEQEKDKSKFKDIINLQKEFSDVTMDVPAPKKEISDIPSPEKKDEDESMLTCGIQSCPSKSITRSRRKLFTPRAEPLEESIPGDSGSNERIRVPRPSYHRVRARRKL